MEKITLQQLKDHFKYAEKVETAFWNEKINLSEYDINSLKEGYKGNFYITHKEDLNLDDDKLSKRLKCLFHVKKGFSKILTKSVYSND